MPTKPEKTARTARPPIVVIMGHIDHGKSTLLDYIRKCGTPRTEAGGITQHLSAYVVEHATDDGVKQITFLDTPGHEAFQKMRLRGADIADIAILVVSAEDGVKPQTLEALACIKAAAIPYIVAINKIDKPSADVARTKASLLENEIYLEGMGGDVPAVAISAQTGEGVGELLDVLLISAEMAELTYDKQAPATGKVIEAHLDERRGTSATLLLTDGTLHAGEYVVAGSACAPVRIMESWSGQSIRDASASVPVGIVGFSVLPTIGDVFSAVKNKKEAEMIAVRNAARPAEAPPLDPTLPTVAILIKADTLGSIDAIEHELAKHHSERIQVRVIDRKVGTITARDVQNIHATADALVIGFNVEVERAALDLAARVGVEVKTFSIIYELSEWFAEALKVRTPSEQVEEKTGRAKVLKVFSAQKNIFVLGGRVEDGVLTVGEQIKILRRDLEIGRGRLKNIQQQKTDVSSVSHDEFGMQVESRAEIAAGDFVETFRIVTQ